MNFLRIYWWICNIIHDISLPKIKFRSLTIHYKSIYQNQYNIDEVDINKASFLIFLSVWMSSILICVLLRLNFVLIILISFTLSLSFSYFFNTYLYKKILKDEIRLNAVLYFIRINYSILRESQSKDSDFILSFIHLLKDYQLPISKTFESTLINIYEGANPENELRKIITPSADFNEYVNNVILGTSLNEDFIQDEDYTMLERRFKVYLKQIETRMSIVFFIGVFFPLGLCFLIMFNRTLINLSILFPFVFFLLINTLFRNLIKNDGFLLGLLNNNNKIERKKFIEFTHFLKSFAYQLQESISPEIAFKNAYSNSYIQLEVLQKPLKKHITSLLNLSCTFAEMIDLLKQQLVSIRYYLILDLIKELVNSNAQNSSKKVFSILKIISTHQKLEKKLEIVLRGEKLKVSLFLFLLPIIIGAIGGMFPIFTLLIGNLNLKEMINPRNLVELIFSMDFLIIYSTLLICVMISSFFFLKTIKSIRFKSFLALICLFYTLLFIISFLSAIALI